MKMWRSLCVLIPVVAWGLANAADQRIALVIGNAAYRGAAELKNPVNDATDMAAKLKKFNFDVTLKTNATQKEMLRTLTAFGQKVQAGAEVLFFYAGHGMQVKGKNYLIPIDAEISTESSVSSEAVDVDQLLDKLASARLSMVILDACRNNPFERRFRGGGQGLAQINAPTGTLIAYATAPGKVAADGEGRNGLYTSELLAAIDVPGLKIEDVFKRVRVNVVKNSYDVQTPWESSSLTGDFYFQQGGGHVDSAIPAPDVIAPRLALLVGVSDYRNLPRLPNISNDVELVSQALSESGFSVTRSTPRTRQALIADLQAFGAVIASKMPEVVVFYYGGHGGRLDGEDWLLPTEVEHDTAEKIRATAYSLYDVWHMLGLPGSPSLNLFLYDTSRTPPPYHRDEEAKSTPRSYHLPNTVFAFAAQPGRHAVDGPDGHGLFTGALVRNLRKPGVTLDAALKRTVDDVVRLAPEGFSSPPVVEGDLQPLAVLKLTKDIRPTRRANDEHSTGALSPASREHPNDGIWVGELETYGGLFEKPIKTNVEFVVARSQLSGTVFMYGETRRIQAMLDVNGNLQDGSLKGSLQGYALRGALSQIHGDGALGWKVKIVLRKK